MRFLLTVGSIGIGSAMLAPLGGCGGSELLPVGGPFGGGLDPGAIVDGGIVSDASGVLPNVAASGGAGIGGTPTWTQLYNAYFQAGTIGRCFPCHTLDVGGTASPSALYAWLASPNQGQVGDDQPALADPDNSCLTWISSNGNMPEGAAVVSAAAARDVLTWARSGAANN